MKQVLQNVKDRKLSLQEVPPPSVQANGIRVRTAASLISAGTERMILDLANKSLVGKAQARPDLVRQVMDKARKEGVVNTVKNVMSKLERPMPLGYSAAGVVESVGEAVRAFRVGDRVAIAGAGYANHAEVNYVPANLAAHIPDNVSFEDASYTTVASIALQGVRLAKPELGDNVVVVGLGLIGLITVQLLKANGCRVIGMDLDASKVELALQLGMDEGIYPTDDAVDAVSRFTGGRLADHTLITASTKSNSPIELAGDITRRRGQVVVVGAVGMSIPRDTYYKKEIEVKISMSYGPGRYDASYEEGGIDYPYDYVRWTEQRNMSAVLDLLAGNKIDFQQLTTHQFAFDDAMEAYDLISDASANYIGIVLNYDLDRDQSEELVIDSQTEHRAKDDLKIGFVGAGNYAALHLLPHLKSSSDAKLLGLVTATGLNAQQKAEKFGFSYCTTDIESVLDERSDALFIATRHGTHAEYACRGLAANKHVFVEKPLVVSEEQLENVISEYEKANSRQPTGLMVGLNRRFAPMISKLKAATPNNVPLQMTYRVNSGHIPTSSWLHEPDEGGGMLIGEMCHFLDLMQFTCGARPESVFATSLRLGSSEIADTDNVTAVVSYDDGSVGTLNYNTVGDKAAPKEQLQVFGGGTVLDLNDFRSLTIFGSSGRQKEKAANQDKGQSSMLKETVREFRTTGQAPIPFEQLIDVMRTVFAIRKSVFTGERVELNPIESTVVAVGHEQ